MNNVIALPDSMQRQWRVFEADLIGVMQEEHCTPAEIDYICEQLKPVYLRYAQPKSFSCDPENVLQELNSWVREQISGLLAQLVMREIKLFRLRGRG